MAIDPTALVALIISIVALVIAVFQLLAQIVGTIEGYRHCQESVLGKWSKHRKRDWSWTQFRYGTLFKTPEITLGPCHNQPKGVLGLYGNDQSRKETYCDIAADKKNTEEQSTELVCWVPLLNALHDGAAPMAGVLFKDGHQREPQGKGQGPSWPCIRLRQRSWDLMPPDVVRPFATTTASDIAILACRMGVKWKDFRPTDGIMEGEGEGHIFSSTRVRGLGTVLSYARLFGSDDKEASPRDPEGGDPGQEIVCPKLRFVWTPAADKLWFGIVPGNPDLKLPDYRIGTTEEIFAALWKIDPEGKAVESFENMQKFQAGYLHGFCDIVPMVAAWLRQPETNLNWYPRPLKNAFGLTWTFAAHHTFIRKLKKYNCDREQRGKVETRAKWVEQQYNQLQGVWGKDWDSISQNPDARKPEFYDALEDVYNKTTEYFQSIKDTLNYMDLVTAHLREAPRSYPDAERAIQDNRAEEPTCSDSKRWRGQAMVYYWEYIPDYRSYMGRKGCGDEDLVDAAWIMLIFRAFLWMRAHIPKEDVTILPSLYHGSR